MSDTKLCPFCAEEIRAAAIKCKHCGSMLEEAGPSESTTSSSPPPPISTPPSQTISIPPPEATQKSAPQNERILKTVQQTKSEADSIFAAENNKAEAIITEIPQKPKTQHLYSVTVKKIENDKAKFAFGKQLNAALKIPYSQLNDYLTQGKVIKRDLEKFQAEELISKLSTPGIQFNLKPQLTSNEKKSFWVVFLSLIAVVISLYYGSKYKPMEEPKSYQTPTTIGEPGSYERCVYSCAGDSKCINSCKCVHEYDKCTRVCSENDNYCLGRCDNQYMRCIGTK